MTACPFVDEAPTVVRNKWDLTANVANSGDVPSSYAANDLLTTSHTSSATVVGFDGMVDTCNSDYDRNGSIDDADCTYGEWTDLTNGMTAIDVGFGGGKLWCLSTPTVTGGHSAYRLDGSTWKLVTG